MASVKVAVRVRPFNQREIDMGCKSIVRMVGNKTVITNPSPKPETVEQQPNNNSDFGKKEFTYDYSYWSVDSKHSNFVSQETIYNDLGKEVVEAAFAGYNACIFAYGQTGSGKTFTMMGRPGEEGLIPRICRQLFCKMGADRHRSGTSYRCEVSYLEIYNERVKDLLNCSSGSSTGANLKVREHPKTGPYVQDLSRHLVTNYGDMQELMARGNANRTTASTNMNDTSSRSHAIFTICFSQASFDNENTPRETISKLNLVDLAGSERANATGATGQRLLEGAHINKSLVTLGSVIKALAAASSSTSAVTNGNSTVLAKRSTGFIPYRDSVLTWLLKDSLGGNSKTIMISTISPADTNYSETLSTLRAKDIINKPTVNEDSNTRLIRDLRSEIDRLRSLLGENPGMLEKLQENEARVRLLTEEWADKWKETHRILSEQRTLGLRKAGIGIVLDSDQPHLIRIDDYLLSTGLTLYQLCGGRTLLGAGSSGQEHAQSVGSSDTESDQSDGKSDESANEGAKKESDGLEVDIKLHGPDILPLHCVLELTPEGQVFLSPFESARCYVNTIQIDQRTQLSQGCVLLLGRSNMFRFNDPQEVDRLRKQDKKGKRIICSSCGIWMGHGDSPNESDEKQLEFEEEKDDNAANKSVDEKEDSQIVRCLNCTMAQSHLLRAGSLSLSGLLSPADMSRSIESVFSQFTGQTQTDFCDLDIEEKRKEIEELEEEHRRAEERRREEAAAADEQLRKKRDELLQLRDQSAQLSQLIAESTRRKQETELELKYLREQKEKLRAEKEQSELINASNLSSIELNADSIDPNINESGLAKHLPENKEPGRTTSSSPISNEPVTSTTELSFSTPNGQVDEVSSKPILDSNISVQSTVISSTPNGTSGELGNLLKTFANRFNLNAEDGKPTPNSNSLFALESDSLAEQLIKQCGEELEAEAERKQLIGQFEQFVGNRLRELFQFEEQLRHLERQLHQQRSLFELQRNKELDAIEKEKFNLDKMERQVRLEALIEKEVQRRLKQQQLAKSNWREGVENRATDYMRLTGSPSPAESPTQNSPPMQRRSQPLPTPAECRQIRIEVPLYVLRSVNLDAHFEYEVRISLDGGAEEWSVFRRYRRFRELHMYLLHKYEGLVNLPPFPPKRWIGNRTEKLAEERRRALESYLQSIMTLFQHVPGCPLNWSAVGQAKLSRSNLYEFSPFFRTFFENGPQYTG